MVGRPRISDAKIAAAMKRNGGIRGYAARDLGCTTQALSYRIKRSKKLQEGEADHIDEWSDLAMRGVIEAINEGHLPTCRRYLNRFGKHLFEGGDRERLSPKKLWDKQSKAMCDALPEDPTQRDHALTLMQEILGRLIEEKRQERISGR
jgi:hypothetical protein